MHAGLVSPLEVGAGIAVLVLGIPSRVSSSVIAFMKEVVTEAIHGNLVSNMMENEL